MTATLIDGLAIAKSLRLQAAERARACIEKGRAAGLAVVLIGKNPASQVYVRNKVKACAEAGITSRLIEKPENLSEVELLSIIDDLNHDPEIDGILVQLPLPKQLDAHRVIEARCADLGSPCGDLWRQ